MKLSLLFILLINLIACENCYIKKENNSNNDDNNNGNNEDNNIQNEQKTLDNINYISMNKSMLEDFFKRKNNNNLLSILQKINKQQSLSSEMKKHYNNFINEINKPIDNMGSSYSHLASIENKSNDLELLIKAGANINNKDHKGFTPLQRAVGQNNKDIVDILLNANADLKSQNNHGDTVFHTAVLADNQEIMQSLLDKASFAEANIKNKQGFTPFLSTIMNNKNNMLKLLNNNKKIDINATDNNGYAALDFALIFAAKNTELISELISNENLIIKSDKILTNTLLNKDFLEAILPNKNFNINERLQNNDTILHLSVLSDKIDMVKALNNIENFDINAQNDDQDTALHLAVRNNSIKLVQELLSNKKIDTNIKNKSDHIALQIAEERGYQKIVELLKNHHK